MEKQFNNNELKEIQDHVEKTSYALASISREFFKVIDPSESPETMEYVRKVSGAFDNVVLTIFQKEDDEKHKTMLRQAREVMIQNLINYHNEGKETH